MDFSLALTDLKNGDQLRRTSWVSPANPDYILMFGPLAGSSPQDTIMASNSGSIYTWSPGNVDICADDWEILPADKLKKSTT